MKDNIMNLINKVKSNQDNTIKYIFKIFGNSGYVDTKTDCDINDIIVEFAYINKDDGKDIICVPSQSSCKQGCKFCHITDVKDKIHYRNLTDQEIFNGIEYIINDLNLIKNQRVLLISYMGCGEPIINYENVFYSMGNTYDKYYDKFPLIRFAIATSLPEKSWTNFFRLVYLIKNSAISNQVKFHLSLHYTIDSIRKEWMPSSLDIIPSLVALEFFRKLTNNSVEIHYALIEGVNDTEQDAILLTEFLKNRDIPVKFLFYNKKNSLPYVASNTNKLNHFKKYFNKNNIQHEYYIPPGLDVGASCGQFLLDYYLNNS